MAKKIYNWKRYWCRLGSTVNLGFGGYLSDPEGEHGNILNPEVNTLASYQEKSFLALLGEPGIGKSHEFQLAFRNAKAGAESRGHLVVDYDLRECHSAQDLIAQVFDNADVDAWRQGDHEYHVYLDSLDEGLLEVRTLNAVMAGQLKRLGECASRLRLRIACRTTDWGSQIQAVAEEIWGSDSVEVLELAPLRLADVQLAATDEGVDPAKFTTEVSRLQVEAFAMNPVTLKLLLDEFRASGAMPSSKKELYHRGCRHLASETSPSRQEAGQCGRLEPDQRVLLAARIAFHLLFCGKSSVYTGVENDKLDSALTLADLAGGKEEFRGNDLIVSEDMIRETVSTGLFSARGSDLFGFAHQTYAEFLAALYLTQSSLSREQRKSLLFHPGDPRKVVPQLGEVAAWHSLESAEIQSSILQGDPQVLLRGDFALADDSVKASLVERLLEGYRSEELDDSDWLYRGFYQKLDHSGLHRQLEPVLLDRSLNRTTRRFACDVAEQCRLQSLQQTLLRVTLDESDLHETRHHAAHAFVATNPPATELRRLLPLASGTAGEDPDGDLRGTALAALWSASLIDAKSMFTEFITEPKRDNYGGDYSHFLHTKLSEGLAQEDIPIALQWAQQHVHYCDKIHVYHYVIDAIIEVALEHLDLHPVRVALAGFIHAGLRPERRVPLQPSHFDEVDADWRREIGTLVVNQIADVQENWYDVHQTCALLFRQVDIPWLISRISALSEESQKSDWAQVLFQVYRQSDATHRDAIIECSTREIAVSEAFQGYFGAVEINSPEAERMREGYQREQELKRRERALADRRQQGEANLSAGEVLEGFLRRSEEGDLNAWWQLTRLFSGTEQEKNRDSLDNLTTYLCWEAAETATRDRIVRAAERYVNSWVAQPDRWLSGEVDFYPDLAGYQALVLLDELNRGAVDRLPQERWANLSSVVFCHRTISHEGNASFQRQLRLVAEVYDRAPESVIQIILKLIDSRNQINRGWDVPFLDRLRECWDAKLMRAILTRAKRGYQSRTFLATSPHQNRHRLGKLSSGSRAAAVAPPMRRSGQGIIIPRYMRDKTAASDTLLRPKLMESVLSVLIGRGYSPALAFARQLVADRSWHGELARSAASALWFQAPDRAAKKLISVFHKDRNFLRSVMAKLVDGHRFSRIQPEGLQPSDIADLYRLMVKEFPYHEDPQHDGAHNVSTREQVGRFRDGFLEQLRNTGTAEACYELAELVNDFPELTFLRWNLRSARRVHLQSSWSPQTCDGLRELLRRSQNRLVRTDRELQHVVLESLERLQERLSGKTPAIRDVWDYQRKTKTWMPIDENDFTDYIARHLKQDLESSGIIALREVEIRRAHKSKGERTDLYIVAVVGDRDRESVVLQVVVEVKGCWHEDVFTAMQDQLHDRYMCNARFARGIYIVGWFLCKEWCDSDSRKGKTRKWAVAEVRQLFQQQAEALSTDDESVSSFVFDLPVDGILVAPGAPRLPDPDPPRS
ncbi:MAG: hypothetical protein AAGG48_26940 [Planctomycetota bacterium]